MYDKKFQPGNGIKVKSRPQTMNQGFETLEQGQEKLAEILKLISNNLKKA